MVIDNSRIEDLRRRVQKDPASIAFAQLAEECRRAGQFEEAVEVCRAGLAIHPGYLSARVTLGRALLELGQLDEAQHELDWCCRARRTTSPRFAAWRKSIIAAARLPKRSRTISARSTLAPQRSGARTRGRRAARRPARAGTPQRRRRARTRRTRALGRRSEQWLAAIHVARAHRRA